MAPFEHPFATYFDVHQGYRVLTHSHMGVPTCADTSGIEGGIIAKLDDLKYTGWNESAAGQYCKDGACPWKAT